MMLHFNNLKKSSWGSGLFLAVLIGLVAGIDLGRGPGAVRSAEAEVDHLTILYHSDCKGKIEPCG